MAATPSFHRSLSTPSAALGSSPTMNRCAMCRTPAAAAMPSARRPVFVLPIFIATPIEAGGSSTSSRKPVRWRARSSMLRQAGTTSTKRNSAALSSASAEARSIAFSSSAFSGLRVDGMAAASLRPTANSSRSSAASSTMLRSLRRYAQPMEREVGLLSVVAPMFEEEEIVARFAERVAAALDGVDYELILVDDGSQDRTADAMAAAATADPRVKVITLARNFGHQPALTAGLDHARGDAVVMLDGDLQDPPEVIPEMLDHWRNGVDVVYAVRRQRLGETVFKRTSARWFYKLFRRLTRMDLPVESGDFRLMDRRALNALLAMPERSRFLRGMTVWIGFTQAAVPFVRHERTTGVTKYPLRKMLRFSFDAITSFSSAPLQWATFLGFVFSGIAFLAIPLAIVARYTNIYERGVPTTIVVVLLLGGIQLITVGIIGEYVGRIYEEVKHRPLYVVRERINVEEPAERP